MLILASVLCFSIGSIHSYFGEKFILIRLFNKCEVPKLFGDTYFTRRTLRFAWHLTTLAWFGFGVILFKENSKLSLDPALLKIVGAVFFFSGLLAFCFTKGKHLSWVIFWTISAICLYKVYL
ncbi:hypothetical protein N9O57_01265 [bacterium]|nr:hypothetical protein [bacterium]